MADTARPIVEIRRVSKVFQLQDQTIHALSDASLSIAKGEFVCLIGASGCGKSTLLRIMAGFEQPSSGEALMWGKPIAEPDPSRGMVFQDYALFPWLSVRENIAFGPIARGLAGAQVKETVANAYPHQLSGGMKQRVAIARVLANDAELVLMDEPFGALDAMTRERLQDELLEIWQRTKLTVVFVTHSVEEAIFLANRVVVMTPGPGRIESDNALDLPRPRDVASPEFNAIRRVLGAKLHSHHGKKAA
jgi:NitT/TauT family transport system ATP-binding protein